MIIIKEKCWCSQGFMDQDGKYGKDEILMCGYEKNEIFYWEEQEMREKSYVPRDQG